MLALISLSSSSRNKFPNFQRISHSVQLLASSSSVVIKLLVQLTVLSFLFCLVLCYWFSS